MALIKWGMFVVDGRGKVGGTVLTKGRSGAVARNKVTPVNPNTARQSAVRALLTQFSQGWSALTQEQRNAWNAAVGSFTKTNIFGDTVSPTGKNLYTGLNNNLLKVGYSAIDDAPLPGVVVAPAIYDFAIELTTPTMAFEIPNESADQIAFIQASPPVSPGVTNISSKLTFIKNVSMTTSATVDIYSEYIAIFGVPLVGQKIFIKVTATLDETGQVTTPEILSAIVAA